MLARSDPTGLRVNLGCGATPTRGWLNLDNSPSARLGGLPWLWPILSPVKRRWAQAARENNVRYGQATRLPLADNSVEVLYSSHMMEHLDRADAQVFLCEAFRVIQPGGYIRLVLPDIEMRVREYLRHKDADEFVLSTHMGTDRPRSLYEWIVYIFMGPRHHLWMYDGASLIKHLSIVGFAEARVLPSGETMIPNPGPLSLEERWEESVYVEARKPV